MPEVAGLINHLNISIVKDIQETFPNQMLLIKYCSIGDLSDNILAILLPAH